MGTPNAPIQSTPSSMCPPPNRIASSCAQDEVENFFLRSEGKWCCSPKEKPKVSTPPTSVSPKSTPTTPVSPEPTPPLEAKPDPCVEALNNVREKCFRDNNDKLDRGSCKKCANEILIYLGKCIAVVPPELYKACALAAVGSGACEYTIKNEKTGDQIVKEITKQSLKDVLIGILGK